VRPPGRAKLTCRKVESSGCGSLDPVDWRGGREMRGLAAGEPWPVDLGPELSRGFRALKVWMTLKTYCADRLGAVVEHCCALAQRLAGRIDGEAALELAAPVTLTIVCFRYRAGDDATRAAIAADLQESGDVVLSTRVLEGRVVLRAAIVNHRTRKEDVDAIVTAVVAAGARRRYRRRERRPPRHCDQQRRRSV
jgi:aromatic-L-amino-acid/L-tryptophan decarboxylase